MWTRETLPVVKILSLSCSDIARLKFHHIYYVNQLAEAIEANAGWIRGILDIDSVRLGQLQVEAEQAIGAHT